MKRLALSLIAAVALVLGITTSVDAYWSCTQHERGEECYWYDDPPPWEPGPYDCWDALACTPCWPCEA